VIIEDQATEEWSKQELSRYDKLPIVGPATPAKRKRELFLRLQESLNTSEQAPLVVAWDYFFPKSLSESPSQESPASKDFGLALSKSHVPIVVGSWTGGGELDTRIHKNSAHRFTGHISLFRDKDGARFSPISRMDQRMREYLTQDTFVVATIAAAIHGKCRVNKNESLRAARQLACQTAEEKMTQEQARLRKSGKNIEINGIKLTEMPVQTISMKSVILNEAEALAALNAAVVIIGNATTDLDDLFKDDKPVAKPTVYVHAWTVAQILSRMATIGPFEKKKNMAGLICSSSP
jgi:CHASE2 domain-containing sensor protein